MKKEKSVFCIEPESMYRRVFERILLSNGYKCRFADMDRIEEECASFSEDVVFLNIELKNMSGFDLVPLIKKTNPETHIVLFTNSNMNEYIEDIIRTNQANVISKPFTKEELLFFLDKLFNKAKVFGLKNYLKPGSVVKTFFLSSSDHIREYVGKILNISQEWGFNFHYDFKIDLVIHELLVNAIYHAHGFEEEKKTGVSISLEDSNHVEVGVGHDENRFGISITDFKGNLTRKRILETILTLESQGDVDELLDKGVDINEIFKEHGRGIDLVRKNTGEYYFLIEKGVRTQVILIFDRFFEKDDEYTSLKIIEI
ncbi:MAG: response regulator [Spirochaetes bacterium]|nr:response regulator [Spirochaetota bacterium]MCK5266550.1 response regulator [Spirochaetota bacterium]